MSESSRHGTTGCTGLGRAAESRAAGWELGLGKPRNGSYQVSASYYKTAHCSFWHMGPSSSPGPAGGQLWGRRRRADGQTTWENRGSRGNCIQRCACCLGGQIMSNNITLRHCPREFPDQYISLARPRRYSTSTSTLVCASPGYPGLAWHGARGILGILLDRTVIM